MNRFFLVFIFLLTPVFADTSQSKVSIEKAWAEMDQAFSSFDARGSVKHLRPDFVMTFAKRPGMNISRDQIIQVMSQKLPQIKRKGGKLKASTRILSLKKVDDTTVKVQLETSGTEQASKDEKVVQVTEIRNETWIRSGGKWTCQSCHVLKDNRK